MGICQCDLSAGESLIAGFEHPDRSLTLAAPISSPNSDLIELGIDLRILGLGIGGALFASDQIRSKLGDHSTGVAIAMIFVDLIITGLCLHLRTWERWQETSKAMASLFLGLWIFGISTTLVLRFS